MFRAVTLIMNVLIAYSSSQNRVPLLFFQYFIFSKLDKMKQNIASIRLLFPPMKMPTREQTKHFVDWLLHCKSAGFLFEREKKKLKLNNDLSISR